jgi:hypothetical protein
MAGGIQTSSGVVVKSNQPFQERPQPQRERQREVSTETKEEDASERSNTTANGDGLILTRARPNIFDMIAQIKDSSQDTSSSSDAEAEQDHAPSATQSQENIFDVVLNERLSPFLYLQEACQQLAALRSRLKSSQQIEQEFLTVLRANNLTKVFTCSHSLNLLLEKYQALSK